LASIQAAVQQAAERPASLSAPSPGPLPATGALHVECKLVVELDADAPNERASGHMILEPVAAPSARSIAIDAPTAFEVAWRGGPGVRVQFRWAAVPPEAFGGRPVVLSFAVRVDGPLPARWDLAVTRRGPDCALTEVPAETSLNEGVATRAEASLVSLDATLQGDVATLHVHSPSPRVLAFVGDHRRAKRWNRTIDIKGATISHGSKFEPILDDMALFADEVRDLVEWLGTVVSLSPDMCLILVDHTELGIPWEMLEIAKDTPIGAKVKIVRWALVNRGKDVFVLDTAVERHLAGPVLAYFDAGLKQTHAERASIAGCAHEELRGFRKLVENLKRPPPGFALLFLACHNTFGEGGSAIRDPDDTEAPQLTPRDLARMRAPQGDGPLVFLNACYSARFPRGAVGFPHLFLSRLSRAFLGTLGVVDSASAAEISKAIIAAATDGGGVRVADALRTLRAKAVEELAEEPDDVARIRRYVTTFLYVFYGSPNTYLELSPAAEGT
jgi:hypothetical protein